MRLSSTRRLRRPALSLAVILAGGCTTPQSAPAKQTIDAAAYEADTKAWRALRLDAIAGPDGWSTLAGFFWLDSAQYSIGSDSTNAIHLPSDHTPARFGTLLVAGNVVSFVAASGIDVRADSVRVDSTRVNSDKTPNPTVLRAGSMTFRVIERGGRLALRVKDSAYVLRREFKGLTYFPLDTAFRVQARLVPHASARTVRILNVLGQTDEYASPGMLEFTIAGRPYQLAATFEGRDSSQYFVVFRDETRRTTTYPAGRFLYAAPADQRGYTVLDFNRAFNPPCAFTAFATCPLPPAENMLNVSIPAGEQRYAGPHGSTSAVIGRR